MIEIACEIEEGEKRIINNILAQKITMKGLILTSNPPKCEWRNIKLANDFIRMLIKE